MRGSGRRLRDGRRGQEAPGDDRGGDEASEVHDHWSLQVRKARICGKWNVTVVSSPW